MTFGDYANGVDARHRGETSSGINSQTVNSLTITTQGQGSNGIYSLHQGRGTDDIDINNIDNYIEIDVRDSTITTQGEDARGIHSQHQGIGDTTIDVRDSIFSTAGDYAHGIFALRYPLHDRGDLDGDINITAQGGSITTQGTVAHGIYARNTGNVALDTLDEFGDQIEVAGYFTGDINIDVQGISIMTESTDIDPDPSYLDTWSHGIYARHQGEGNIDIDVRAGTMITTKGVDSYGIYARHQGEGDIDVDIQGSTITTESDETASNGTHGIRAEHEGTGSINIVVGGGSTVNASGQGASGIYTSTGQLDEDGYAKQTVTVNGRVFGGTGTAINAAAGVYLDGGGRVYIGPQGSIRAASGIAILATGRMPKLYLDMNLDGRRVAEVIGDNYIMNDEGETTIVVNNVMLHDGATGITGMTAENGIWDVTMRAEGVKVTDRSDPDNWTITEPAIGVFADRDFSTQDFIETDSGRGTDPDQPPAFDEVYAPRAALYEALPSLLLRMQSRGPVRNGSERPATPDAPAWVRFSGAGGTHEPDRTRIDSEYDFDRFEVEAGVECPLGKGLSGSLALRHVQGSGDISSPVGGGDIDIRGLGVAVGMFWEGENGSYLDGRFSLADYDVDFDSDLRGGLANDVGSTVYSLGLEAGRPVALSERVTLTPRAWVRRLEVDLDDFTDAVDSRVSGLEAKQYMGGLGLVADTERALDSGARLSVYGALDVEYLFSGRETSVEVSGEELESESDETRVLLEVGGVYRRGSLSLSGEVSAHGLSSDDEEYSGSLNLAMRF